MSVPLEDYVMIGDTYTAGLVSRRGSIDWLCLPRFDSGACFAALLGRPEQGHWSLSPAATGWYRGDSLVLETSFSCVEGEVRVIDCMPTRNRWPDVMRRVEGVRGRVPMAAASCHASTTAASCPGCGRTAGDCRS